jgi:hypothetical protein
MPVVLPTSTELAVAEPTFSNAERLALAGFLAGYTGLTREAYALDLRQYASWCQQQHARLFEARRAEIERFARDLEARGRARATVTRRLCTVAGFCRYAVEEELLDHSPAAHVRRPRLDYESHATGLDRNELGAHPQRWQGRHHPARAADSPRGRPGHRRALRRTDLPRPWRPAARPAGGGPDRPPDSPACRDRQECRRA